MEEPAEPIIFEAILSSQGSVQRGRAITQGEAEARRRAGEDVVVCGSNLAANRNLARLIECNANGSVVRHPPHTQSSGPNALPHYQPDPRPPAGHTFYETEHRKAH
jgi:hypothetical protein